MFAIAIMHIDISERIKQWRTLKAQLLLWIPRHLLVLLVQMTPTTPCVRCHHHRAATGM